MTLDLNTINTEKENQEIYHKRIIDKMIQEIFNKETPGIFLTITIDKVIQIYKTKIPSTKMIKIIN